MENMTIREYYELNKKEDYKVVVVDGDFKICLSMSDGLTYFGGKTIHHFKAVHYLSGGDYEGAITNYYEEDMLMVDMIKDFKEYVPKEIQAIINYDLGID